MNLFKDILPSLLHGKNPVCESPEDFKDYMPFMVNKALSYYPDCVLFANEMNMAANLPVEMQYDFYFYGLRKMKRPNTGKWAKAQVEDTADDILRIMSALNYSHEKAEQILPLLSPDDLERLRSEQTPGARLK